LLPQSSVFKRSRAGTLTALALTATLVAACNSSDTLSQSGSGLGETFQQGHIIDDQTIALVPVGSSREQVLLAFGSPSTTATFDNEVFYYISQTRQRSAAFMNKRLVSQRVLAVYFGSDGRVQNIANYGMQDGKVFDFISRTTPTGGRDQNFLRQIIGGVGGGIPRMGGS
jgi:outer membrane protein assembly factor BamE (lipoprotein component of BamABCDE complex)